MKVFKFFSRSSNDAKLSRSIETRSIETRSIETTDSNCSTAKSSRAGYSVKEDNDKNKNGTAGKAKSGRKTKEAGSETFPPKEVVPPNEDVLREFFKRLNEGAPAEKLMELLESPDTSFVFDDGVVFPGTAFVAIIDVIRKSFPNFKLSPSLIKETRNPGVLLAEEMIASGTHTGEPFCFAHHPPIARTNLHVVNDPERAFVTIRDGKIVKWEVIALGNQTGVHGLYQAIGGHLGAAPGQLKD